MPSATDGQVLGVVEAKKLTLGPQGVLTQAERYSKGIHQVPMYQGEFGVPFLYSTNGEVIWFHDVRHQLNRSRRVSGFHTPERAERDARPRLRRRARRARARSRMNLRLRPYQVEANTAIEQAIARAQAQDARGDGDRHRQDVHDGQRDLPADEVRRRPPRPVPRRPPRPRRPGRPGLRIVRGRAGPEVRQDLRGLLASASSRATSDEDEKFDPNVMPNSLPDEPEARRRLRLRLHDPAHGDQPVRRRGRASTIGDEPVDEDAEQARHPDPRLRPDRRRRVPPRLLGQGAVGLAQHARPLRRHQDRPDRHAGRPHDGLLREPGLPLRVRAGGPRGLPGRLRRRAASSRTSA